MPGLADSIGPHDAAPQASYMRGSCVERMSVPRLRSSTESATTYLYVAEYVFLPMFTTNRTRQNEYMELTNRSPGQRAIVEPGSQG